MPPHTSNPTLADMVASLRRQWSGLQPGQRRTLVAAGAVAAVGLLTWAALAARPPAMAPLFTNLSPQDGAAIVSQLQHDHTPYRLADNGQTILVPRTQVDALRLQLAGQGLPSQGDVGLGAVLSLPFGATDFTRQVAYQQALQNELAATIQAVQGVRAARVQIVLPQSADFGGGGTPASAAVLVDLQPGVSLSPGQVAGITHLVASSVQGLDPSNVTVLDQSGQVLNGLAAGGQGAAGLGGVAAQASDDLQVEQQFDDQLQQRLQRLLDQVFGPGNVVAQMQSQLSFDTGMVQRQLFSPRGSPAVLASVQRLQQTVSGQGPGGAGGVPGTTSNSFPPTYRSAASGAGTSSSRQVTENFDVSQENDTTTVAPGALSRLSVAVVVNSPLTSAQARLVRQTVEAAVGYDAARRDQISVVGLPFNRSLLQALSQQPVGTGRLNVVHTVLPLLAVAVPLLAVIAYLWRRRPAVAGEAAAPALAAEGEADALDGAVAGALQAAHLARMRTEASLRERPEDVARVIRAWLAEDE